MDFDAVHRQDRSSPAPTVRVHSHRVAASQPIELTPSMAFAMIARDADAAASDRSATRAAPRAAIEVDLAALDLPAGAALQAPGSVLTELATSPPRVSPPSRAPVPPGPVSPGPVFPGPEPELDVRTDPDADLDVLEDESTDADADVAPPPTADVLSPNLAPRRRRRRWWQRLLRRPTRAACSMCYSETLPCPLGHP